MRTIAFKESSSESKFTPGAYSNGRQLGAISIECRKPLNQWFRVLPAINLGAEIADLLLFELVIDLNPPSPRPAIASI